MKRLLMLLALLLVVTLQAAGYDNLTYGAPVTPKGLVTCILDREGFALGYSELHEQAAWVCYRLTREEVLFTVCERSDKFKRDRSIPTGSALPSDYSKSGYDKGHLAPAADMLWSEQAMADSFLMSNMSPQRPNLNRNVWRMLEEYTRRLAVLWGEVYVVTGPVLPAVKTRCIGINCVTVPEYYFKVLFKPYVPYAMLAFLVPNSDSTVSFYAYAVTADRVEEVTGYDLFPLLPEPMQSQLESGE